ncbi:MAG: prolipoprotein diacylglyceryl transferase [Defluviitaleaceae bacterium]|nr:prolipoprotein diacylglyceryl transferase [Defluviitaleaceae bacterium]
MNFPDIWFYYLNIRFYNVSRVAISLFGLNIYWYGVIIAFAVFLGSYITTREAKRTGQNPEIYSDFLFWIIPGGIIGARLYYIIFSSSQNITDIFDFRTGGLAIYGMIIGSTIMAFLFCKRRKINFGKLLDTSVFALVLGQSIGRFGNFINREAFGVYTNNIFALRYRVDQLNFLPPELANTIINYNGVDYVQVHPTFLYESFFNLILFTFLIFFRKHKKFEGHLLMIYLVGYGTVRAFLETLRTDSLMIGQFRVSVIFSIIIVVLGILGILYNLKVKKVQGN